MPPPNDDDSFTFSDSPPSEPSATPDTFRILILADLTARENRRVHDLASLRSAKLHTADTDTLPKILASLRPSLQLPLNDSATLPLTFKTLDDFHPDSLLQQIPSFKALAQLRAALLDPTTAHDTAAKVRTLMGEPTQPTPTAPAESPPPTSDFERLLNQPLPAKPHNPADAFIQNLVANSSAPNRAPDHPALLAFLEHALSTGLRAVLRHPAFQSLESAWRGIAFLTSRLNTDTALKISLLDISKPELAADLASPEPALHYRLVEQSQIPGAIPFSLVLANFEFNASPEDVALLARLATLCQAADLPAIAAAAPTLAGITSFADLPNLSRPPQPTDLWTKLRALPQSAHLALAAPPFLARLPYGPTTDPIDTFPFTEIPAASGTPNLDAYLWINPAFALAHAIAQGVLANDDDPTAPIHPDLDLPDLPAHITATDGESHLTPCAQAWLTERAAHTLHTAGIVPLLSIHNTAALHIAGIHSLANTPLAGRIPIL